MNFIKNKYKAGVFGILIGAIIFIFLVDVLSKPNNYSMIFNPLDSLQTYYFGFVYWMGELGYIIGTLLLICYLLLSYLLAIWAYQQYEKRKL